MKQDQFEKLQSKWCFQRNFLALLTLFLLLIVLLQSIFLFGKKERVVFIPPTLEQGFWLESSKVSPAYLEQTALFLAGQLFSKTPQSAMRQRSILLRQSSLAFAKVLSAKLLEEEESLLKQNVSYMFYFEGVDIIKPQEVLIRGERVGFVNQERVFSEKESYRLSFVVEGMRLLLDSVEKIKDD